MTARVVLNVIGALAIALIVVLLGGSSPRAWLLAGMVMAVEGGLQVARYRYFVRGVRNK